MAIVEIFLELKICKRFRIILEQHKGRYVTLIVHEFRTLSCPWPGPAAVVAGADIFRVRGLDRRCRRPCGPPLPRILRRHHPQQKHPPGLCPGRPRFFAWCEVGGLGAPRHRADARRRLHRAALPAPWQPTVKQHLAAIRMLFDWLVTGQVVTINPANSVRGPKHVVKRGKLRADRRRGPRAARQYRHHPPWLACATGR